MIVAVCVDNNMGVLFNNRRQSQDKVLIQDFVKFAGLTPIHIHPYSASLFDGVEVICEESFLENLKDDYYFIEHGKLAGIEKRIDRLIVYKWNREYPADTYLDLDLNGWNLIDSEDFAGCSHPKITRETYKRIG